MQFEFDPVAFLAGVAKVRVHGVPGCLTSCWNADPMRILGFPSQGLSTTDICLRRFRTFFFRAAALVEHATRLEVRWMHPARSLLDSLKGQECCKVLWRSFETEKVLMITYNVHNAICSWNPNLPKQNAYKLINFAKINETSWNSKTSIHWLINYIYFYFPSLTQICSSQKS